MIFQEPMTSLNPVFAVGFQIAEVLMEHLGMGRRAALARAAQLMDEVGIPAADTRLHDYPHQLSGGMRQRVMIAMALACQPKLLIADEPTTALDVTIQAQILALIRALRQERGTAVMLITHDMGVIAEMADQVMVMYLGREVERGPVDAIFHDPLHPYTRALLRSIPNVLAAPRTRLATIAGSIPHPYQRPRGCPFHPRCSEAIAGRCDVAMPAVTSPVPGREVSCFLHGDADVST
jgi:peptide/nickel transport system ATP-binding protein